MLFNPYIQNIVILTYNQYESIIGIFCIFLVFSLQNLIYILHLKHTAV